VRTISNKVLHSTTLLLPQWKELLVDLDIAVRILPRDVKTRWNSTFDMINVILQYKRPVQQFTASAEHGLRDYELTGDEWTALEDLRDSLKHATLCFSRASATLASVVPMMDKIDSLLATATEVAERLLCTPLKVALLQAKHTLNRYYSKTYDSHVYRVAMRTK
ncbi:hypothetical protein C8F01DRAFT_988345, partial [Mycena amicta]